MIKRVCGVNPSHHNAVRTSTTMMVIFNLRAGRPAGFQMQNVPSKQLMAAEILPQRHCANYRYVFIFFSTKYLKII
jgi:hypothetical protein